MLIKGILEEQFVSTKIKGVPTSNISVYLVLGKKYRNLKDKKIILTIPMGSASSTEMAFVEEYNYT
jgi:hypothetical protein